MKNIVLSLALATIAATAAPTMAAVYKINSIIESNSNGFGSSGFHSQQNGPMSLPWVEKFDSSFAANGIWDTSITSGDNISFSGKLKNNGGDVAASGNLSATSSRTNGVHGSITFTITNSVIAGFDGIYEMIFADQTFVGPASAPIANALLTNSEIGLWGDLGNYNSNVCSASYDCLGIDLRLGVSQVPLPASCLLLIAGLGGLGAMRKLRKNS